MHRLPSSYIVRRFRITAMLVVLQFLMIPVLAGFVIIAIVLGEHRWFVGAGAALGLGLSFVVVNMVVGMRLRCPLCMVPPLVNRRCSKHKTATRFLRSHRLQVALTILLRGWFRCPYCGEPTAMKVRQRGGG